MEKEFQTEKNPSTLKKILTLGTNRWSVTAILGASLALIFAAA